MFRFTVAYLPIFICIVTLKRVDSEALREHYRYGIKEIEQWPKNNITFGQLSAVAFDNDNNVVLFHRGSHVWDEKSFYPNNTYALINEGPIQADTVVVLNNATGEYLFSWGAKMFYMPHGLTVDADGNVWITDVAMHQVLKYGPKGQMLLLALGTKFEPGSDDEHFCKPTSVAVLENGDFFVADGYCNSRLIKYTRAGSKLLHWGLSDANGVPSMHPTPYSLFVPHALAVINSSQQICVADREHGRVVCYDYSAQYQAEYKFPNIIGARLFSLAYAPADGGKLFVVNGPNYQPPYYDVKGFIISIPKNSVEASFGPFQNPHDIAVNALGTVFYVVEYKPPRVHKFEIYFESSGVANRSAQSAEKGVTASSAPVGGHVVLGLIVTSIVLLVVFLVYYIGFKRRDFRRYGRILEDDADSTESVSLFPQD